MNRLCLARPFVAVVLAGCLAAPAAGAAEFRSRAPLTGTELACSAAVAKNYAKLQGTILKAIAKCHADDLSGKTDDPNDCRPLPAAAQAKVDDAKAKFLTAVAAACSSVCSISTDKACINDVTCPPKHVATPANNAIAERCLGKGGTAPFDIRNLGWPGPFCDAILGQAMKSPFDLGICLARLADSTALAVDRAVVADLNGSSGLGAGARKCVGSIHKAVQKATARAYAAAASCRDRRGIAGSGDAWACGLDDATTLAAVQKELAGLEASVGKACTDADIASLTGLCAGGGSQPTTVAEAKACLGSMVREVATLERAGDRRSWSPIGMLQATHPDAAAPRCGDGLVSSVREEHTGVGEECDGDADSACPGHCLPPGDLFECTCDTTARERLVVDGAATDSDAGWKGSSHDATHNDGFGYVSALSNCDCSAFDQATCTGTSSDPVCDVKANTAPRCSDEPDGPRSCDQRGNKNGTAENWDCFRCDDNSLNAGTWCANGSNANETACQSQCFDDVTGTPMKPAQPCQTQADCGAGKTCKGRCDNTLTCNILSEGSPLPQVAASISVCIVLDFKTDVTGTKNIVTGETALSYTTRSNIQLGTLFTEPCPVCGGVCVGGSNAGNTCFGRCDASGASCLMDSDCTGPGDGACLETADDCSGGTCSLDLRCSAGPNAGGLCRVDAATPFGVMSHDCPPDPATNLSGQGVIQISGGPMTTGVVEFPAGAPCTDSSWGNYDCPCPADSASTKGVPTRPNLCAAACNGGANEGKPCAVAGGTSGVYTSCDGGSDDGLPCDEDADCEGGTCSSNPSECVSGDRDKVGMACESDAECGGGGQCEDSCPGALCVPLCVTQGACIGGSRDGDACASDRDCRVCTAGNPLLSGAPCTRDQDCDSTSNSADGACSVEPGVSCTVDDPEDGLCQAGPSKYRCTGDGYRSLPCTMDRGTCAAGTCTSGSASKLGSACTHSLDCLVNGVPVAKGCEAGDDGVPGNADDHPGAGLCEPRPEDCFVNNGRAEGGTTLNGKGSPSNVKLAVDFCTPPNGNTGVDDTSGFGGPSRIRRVGRAFVNVPALP